MAKIGSSAFKKLNRTWAAVRSHRLFVHSDVWELWSRPHFARRRHCRRFLFWLHCRCESCAHIPLMCVGIFDWLARHLHPLSLFSLSLVGSAQPTRRAPASVAAVQASKQKFQGNAWMFRLAGKDSSHIFYVPLFGWKLSLTFSNLIWGFIISPREFSPVQVWNIFSSCSWWATTELPEMITIPICSQNAHVWGRLLQKLKMSMEQFKNNSQSECNWTGKGWILILVEFTTSRSEFHSVSCAKKLIGKA